MKRQVCIRVSLVAMMAAFAGAGWAAPSDYPVTSNPTVNVQVAGAVKEITIKGNKVQTAQGIKASMRTKVGSQFNQATLDLDRETLFDLGVFKVEPNMVATLNPDGTYSITIEVVENPVIKEIRVAGNTAFTRQQILAVTTIKAGDILSARAESITSQNITKLYVGKGYYARVTDLSYLPESPQTLNIQVLEDTVTAVQITGNTRTKRRVFDHLIKTRPGEAFNSFKWQRDMQRVFNTGWFTKLDPKRDPGAPPGQIALDVGVKEGRTGNANVGVQVDPQSSFAGFIRYTETNLKGTGQSLGAGYTQGTRGGGPSVDVDYGNPFIDSKDTGFHMRVYSSVVYRFTNSIFGGVSTPTGTQQYLERHTGTSFGFSRPIKEDLAAGLNFRFEGVKTDDIDPNNGNGFIQQDGYIATVSAFLSKDTRDTTIDASRGYFLSGTVEPGFSDIQKVGGLIANQSYIGTSGFVKLTSEFRKYISQGPPRPLDELDAARKVLALRVRAGTVIGPIPFFEQFFAGGADSVRGYDEDRFWGKNTLLSTIEYRYPIQKSFSLISFVDYGGAWGGYSGVNSFTQKSNFSMHVGYGLGIAFKTPLGLIRLDLGVNEHGGTRTHFQIGPSF